MIASIHGNVVMLIWWPNGIAVATLYLLPRKKWPFAIALFMASGFLINICFGLQPYGAFGRSLANFSEAAIAAAIAQWVTRGKHGKLLRLSDMFLLVGAAAAGALSSTVIASYFLADTTGEFSWSIASLWFVSVMLGTLVSTPLVLLVVQRLFNGPRQLRRGEVNHAKIGELALTALLAFILSYFVLHESNLPLLFLPMSLSIFAATRYGYIGAAVSVLAFSLAGTIVSADGQSPAAFLDFNQVLSSLLLQFYMIVLLSTSVPLAALLMAYDRLGVRLRARNARMRENLTWLGMAEEVARIGRWRYDPRTGEQDWSRQMFLINGLDPNKGSDPGDTRVLLPDGGEELHGQLAHHAKDRARYSFEYRIRTPQGDERILKIHATNEFDKDGEQARVFGVVMDVTEHHQRQDALDKERTRAMRLAADAQYLAQTDPLTGLANRRRTMNQLEKCIIRCEEEGRPLALIAFDIDHFKQVNDSHGHQVGDEVLVRVAEIARDEVRASDLIGRTGGEEFVWLLPDAHLTEATNAAERLCRAIEHNSGKNGLPQVTASIGYAIWKPSEDASALLGKADAALYAAKDAGRNRVRKAA
jgi:diguanylate cyclase (GGDEF)-like protein/PAS domain S-box-containing protein